MTIRKINLEISQNKVVELLIGIYVFFAILCINIPKAICFALICFVTLGYIVCCLKYEVRIAFYGLIFPLLIILMSSAVSGSVVKSVTGTYVLFTLLLLIPIKYCHVNYEKIFYRAVWLIVILTLFIWTFDVLGIADVNVSNPVRNIIYKYNIGLMGKSPTYYFYWSIFLYASPLMMFLLFKKASTRKWIAAIVIFGALVLTGERTPVLLGIIGLLYYEFFCDPNRKTMSGIAKIIIGLIIFALVTLFLAENIGSIFHDIMFVKGAVSNNTRSGEIAAIINTIKKNPSILLFGQGMGSGFFSVERGLHSASEFSYLNLLRMMGGPFFAIFMYFILYPFKYIRKEDPNFVAYICYLIQAGLNPFLFDSTAFLVYIYIYSKYAMGNLNKTVIYK